MDIERLALEDVLFQRAGEFAAHLGRYDMYALLLETLLVRGTADAHSRDRRTLSTRGSYISHLMSLRGLSPLMQAQFAATERELQCLLQTHEISALNMATGGTFPLNSDPAFGATQRDWYDHANANEAQLRGFIRGMEQDILSVVRLYMQLAAFAADVRVLLARLH
jgi:hypothetical protein